MDDSKIAQDRILNWIQVDSTNKERFDFLRNVLDNMPEIELPNVANLLSKAKKRRKRRAKINAVSAPVSTVSVPAEGEDGGSLIKAYELTQIVSLDVEKVEVYDGMNKSKKPKYSQKAGSIAVVNSKKEVIYTAKIFRKFGSYRTTVHTRRKNGFTERSLQEQGCKSIETVQNDLYMLLEDKLVVGINIINDFLSLDLAVADFDILDLQWQWYREYASPKGKPIKENLSLRSLCMHFFNDDVQPDLVIHKADDDAVSTMRLFMDVYIKIMPTPASRRNPLPSNDIAHYKP